MLVLVLLGAGVVMVRELGGEGRPAAERPAGPPAGQPTGPPAEHPPVPPVPAPPEYCDPATAVAQLPLRRRLAQLVMVGVDPEDPEQARRIVAAEQVGGIFVGGTATGLLTDGALDQVQQVAELPVAVAVDDEGGRVQRIDAIAGSIPSARRMAAILTPQQVYELARDRGAALRASGVTVNFAPLLDVSGQPDDEVIGDRSFAADPEVVTRYADAFATGLRDAGVLPVFKHFPGHGRADGDSHAGAVTTPPVAELQRSDLLPYRRVLGGAAAAVMLGHLDVPGLTAPSAPASISPAVVAMLRDEFDHHGLIISDDLGAMRAIRDRMGLPEAMRQALVAGVDVALWTTDDPPGAVLDHLEQAMRTGALPQAQVDAAAARVLLAKGVDPCDLS